MKKINLDFSSFEEKLNIIVDAQSSFEDYIKVSFDNHSKKIIDNTFYSLPQNIFNKLCYVTLNPQSYGSKFEQKFGRQYNLEKVSSKLERGDLTNGLLYFEYKSSIMTKNDPVVNIVQIRLNHNIDYYIIQIIDARNPKDCNLYATLSLSKDQMKNECNLAGNNSAHGKSGEAGLRIDLKFGSESFNRFITSYQFNEDILKI